VILKVGHPRKQVIGKYVLRCFGIPLPAPGLVVQLISKQFAELRRYSIERTNRSVALIVMNIRIAAPAPAARAPPVRRFDFDAGNTATSVRHCERRGIRSTAVGRPASCAARPPRYACWTDGRLCKDGEIADRRSLAALATKTHQRTTICNASLSHRLNKQNASSEACVVVSKQATHRFVRPTNRANKTARPDMC